MKFGSLFAGIGGFDLGFERAGMTCAWQVEIDDFCKKVLTKHWPDVPKYGDIRDVGKHNLETVDLICGGFPCQPFSVAGKQRGTEDDRHLWPEMLRVISELKPTWVVGENVPGIVNIFLDTAISDLEAEGYTCETFILPACAFNAPHRRDRLWVVAYSENARNKRWARFGTNNLYNGSGGGCNGKGSHIDAGKSEPIPNVADTERARQSSCELGQREIQFGRRSGWSSWGWTTEPDVGRRLDGFPSWLERHIGKGMSYGESKRAAETLQGLWNDDVSKALWETIGGYDRLQKAEILFSIMREYKGKTDEARLLLESKEALESKVRSMWNEQEITSTPHQSGHNKQSTREYSDAMQAMSRLFSFDGAQNWQISNWEDGISRVATGVEDRVDRLKSLGNAVVPQVAEFIGRMIMEVEDA